MKKVIRIQGLDTQSITPNRIIVEDRADGKTNVYYSNKGDVNHGHTVLNTSGEIDYARSRGGIFIKILNRKLPGTGLLCYLLMSSILNLGKI